MTIILRVASLYTDQQPPSPLAPSAPEVLPPQPELPPSPQPQPTQPLPQITQPLAQPPLQSTQLQAQPWQPAELQHQAAVTGKLYACNFTSQQSHILIACIMYGMQLQV